MSMKGAAPPCCCVHPGVGWSFMYSDMIQELRGRFRCVALDLPGFGLSAAAPGYRAYTDRRFPAARTVHLGPGLTDVTLFSHDVTGSIALGVVARRPEWFRAVIVLPSFAWPLESYRRVYPMIQLIGSPVFRFLSYHFNFFLEYTLKNITKKPKQHFSERRSKPIADPILTDRLRRYPHDLFKSVTKSHDYLADLEADAERDWAHTGAAHLWRPGCYNQNGVVGSTGAHLPPAPYDHHEGQSPFPPDLRFCCCCKRYSELLGRRDRRMNNDRREHGGVI